MVDSIELFFYNKNIIRHFGRQFLHLAILEKYCVCHFFHTQQVFNKKYPEISMIKKLFLKFL